MTSINERQYQIPFCQLISAEDETLYYISSHGQYEKGKDVVSVDADGVVNAYQLKAGDIDLSTWRKIAGEISELVELPVSLATLPESSWHRPFLVTNGRINDVVDDHIKAANEGWRKRGFKYPLTVVDRSQLTKRFERLHGTFLPSEPENFKSFLGLVLRDGSPELGKFEFSQFLEAVLPFDDETTPLNCKRALASATVFTSYIAGPALEVANHWAVFESWVVMASYTLALASKHKLGSPFWKQTYELCVNGAERAILSLLDECKSRTHTVEGDPLLDGIFYRYRLALLGGLFSSWLLHCRIAQRPFEREDEMKSFLTRRMKGSHPWGESATPYYAMLALLLEGYGHKTLAEAVIGRIISIITGNNRHQLGKRGLPNPYYGPTASARLLAGLDLENDENFAGFAYTVEPLIEFLARRGCRHRLTGLWSLVTRLSLVTFNPHIDSDWFRWKTEDGQLRTRLVDEPQSWRLLVEAAHNRGTDNLPLLMREQAAFLPLFIAVYPHRYSVHTQKLLEDALGN